MAHYSPNFEKVGSILLSACLCVSVSVRSKKFKARVLKFYIWIPCQKIAYPYFYTPGIYADGYIVFAFPLVRSYVRSFVRSWNLRQSFALKFLKWCISQQLLIRKHSYLDHSYPGGLAFTP